MRLYLQNTNLVIQNKLKEFNFLEGLLKRILVNNIFQRVLYDCGDKAWINGGLGLQFQDHLEIKWHKNMDLYTNLK
jgi:hypothetical protein